MISVAVVRGTYLNNFELQNYLLPESKVKITAIGSYKTIHQQLPFPVIRLPSLADLPISSRAIKIIANRTIGDAQILFGLEKYASDFDIFHTADPHYYYSYQLAKLRASGKIKKLVATSWETIPHNNETIERKRKNKYEVLRVADHFICYTTRAKEALLLEGVDENKISVVRIGVDLTRFFPLNASDRRNSKREILFVGRLVPEKGIMDLYTAFSQLKRADKLPAYSLKIVGDGPLRSQLENKIQSDGLTQSVTIASYPYSKMPEIYRHADLFVLSSRTTSTWEEQYGMVLSEAMASGLPIIATNTGAIAEIVGNAGVLVSGEDSHSLSQAILKLANDARLMKAYGEKARNQAVQHFDSQKAATELLQVYEHVHTH